MEMSRAKVVACKTLFAAAQCLNDLADRVDDTFAYLVDALEECRGSVIVTGVGKCRVIAEKIAATFASSGTFSFPMCALEALHGDLGRVRRNDFIVALSTSGETRELLTVVSQSRGAGARVAAITRSRFSSLGRAAEFVLEIGDHPEAGPLGVFPTTSTTAMLALGDALAMALVDRRGFDFDDLAKVHPGGFLGAIRSRQSCASQTTSF